MKLLFLGLLLLSIRADKYNSFGPGKIAKVLIIFAGLKFTYNRTISSRSFENFQSKSFAQSSHCRVVFIQMLNYRVPFVSLLFISHLTNVDTLCFPLSFSPIHSNPNSDIQWNFMIDDIHQNQHNSISKHT